MNPGPENPSVLTLQNTHRSTSIWEGKECGSLATRSHLKGLLRYEVDPEVALFVSGTQFCGIARLCYVPLDPDLITALVERWRQETHTFHFPFGEVTITLQDVNVLFGLRIGGRPVTGTNNYIWADLLQEHLGIRPPPEALDGSKLKLTWLRETFRMAPRDENENVNLVTLHCYVRAYLLYLIGAVLFPDKSGSKVNLIYLPLLIDLSKLGEISWGSGVLAYLYRNLCNASKIGVTQICGPLLLLQFWSWERISIGRPKIVRSRVNAALEEGVAYPKGMGTQMKLRSDPLGCKWLRIDRSFSDHKLGLVVYRDAFDYMNESQFLWMPYTPDILDKLNPICYEDEAEWIVIAPLICFDAVEWHLPNRCVRQFGYHQEVPPLCNTSEDLHVVGKRGVGIRDFALFHADNIVRWNDRKTKLVEVGPIYVGPMNHYDEYLIWYRSITRRQISPPEVSRAPDYSDLHSYAPTSTDFDSLAQMGVYNYNQARQLLASPSTEGVPLSILRCVKNIERMSLQTLQNTQQAYRIQQEQEDEISGSQDETPTRDDFEDNTQEIEARAESSSQPRKRKTRRQR